MAGFITGLIAPSRDMLVRAAAPPGGEDKAFGIVSTGFNIGGAVGPVLFGWLLDHGLPRGIFWASAGFMALTVILTLLQERRSRDNLRHQSISTTNLYVHSERDKRHRVSSEALRLGLTR